VDEWQVAACHSGASNLINTFKKLVHSLATKEVDEQTLASPYDR
jgi:hypothetical protein